MAVSKWEELAVDYWKALPYQELLIWICIWHSGQSMWGSGIIWFLITWGELRWATSWGKATPLSIIGSSNQSHEFRHRVPVEVGRPEGVLSNCPSRRKYYKIYNCSTCSRISSWHSVIMTNARLLKQRPSSSICPVFGDVASEALRACLSMEICRQLLLLACFWLKILLPKDTTALTKPKLNPMRLESPLTYEKASYLLLPAIVWKDSMTRFQVWLQSGCIRLLWLLPAIILAFTIEAMSSKTTWDMPLL